MSAIYQSEMVEALADSLEIPVSAYEAADRRYLELAILKVTHFGLSPVCEERTYYSNHGLWRRR
jgi:hypothetical protein